MTIAGTQPCARCAALEQEFAEFRARFAQLESELAAAKKNSRNSSKPPSSDIVKKPKDPPKDGKKRKIGGQPGHELHEHEPFPDDEVDFVELHCIECPDCHGPVVPSKNPPKVIQQVDLLLPSEMISVVGFRSHPCWCRKCKQVHYAPVDEATRRAGLVGPRLTCLIAYLKGACHCSYTTIAKFIRDVLNIKLSTGLLAKLICKASASLDKVYEELAFLLPSEPRLNVDETGHKNNGEPMWTWCFRASLYTLFKIDKSRGSDFLIETLSKNFNGILGCDYFSWLIFCVTCASWSSIPTHATKRMVGVSWNVCVRCSPSSMAATNTRRRTLPSSCRTQATSCGPRSSGEFPPRKRPKT